MSNIIELETERLKLRQWQASDYPVFAKLNADPEVMKYFPSIKNKHQSDAQARKLQTLITEQGWGLWVTELKSDHSFIGFVGLNKPGPELPCSPCIEIGWRLAKEYWGAGYATEAAKTVLNFAFNYLKLQEVVSFTVVCNLKSQAVMERLKMYNTKQNFQHPKISADSPLCEHVLYKITKSLFIKEKKLV